MMSRSDELEDFKNRINLSEFAASMGYELDRKGTSRNSAMMVSPLHEKIIIAKGHDGHWIYFTVGCDHDSGSIIDFVKHRKGLNLGQIRQHLRPWLGGSTPLPRPPASSYVQQLEPVPRDILGVRARLEAMPPVTAHHPYLVEQRAIPLHVIIHPCFQDRIRTDARGNAVFPHWNETGKCGYEVKGQAFTGFASGGTKGLWCSRPRKTDTRLVIAETAIDALSYAALHGVDCSRFVSVAGQMSKDQAALLTSAMNKMLGGSTVIAATDNDDGGHALAGQIKALHDAQKHPQITFKREHPPTPGHDFNDVLRVSMADLKPSPPGVG